jgi:two-component system response regulator YesN
LIIVDDEDTARDGLADLLDWQDLGYRVTGTFADGAQALAHLEEHRVDVILSDIKMTFMNGIELAERCRVMYPGVLVVLISGYKDFEFARQAIRHGVSRYLLKPFRLGDFVETFTSLRREMDAEQAESAERREMAAALQEQFVTDLALGALRDPYHARRRMEMAALAGDPDTTPCAMFRIRLSDDLSSWSGAREELNEQVKLILHEQKPSCLPIRTTRDSVDFLAIGEGSMDAGALVEAVGSRLGHTLRRMEADLGIVAVAEILSSFPSLLELGARTQPPDGQATRGELGAALAERRRLLASHVTQRNREEARSLLGRVLEELGELPVAVAHTTLVDLFSELARRLADLGLTGVQRSYARLVHVTDWARIQTVCQELLDEYLTANQETGKTASHAVAKAKDFIHRNSDQDLSLDLVAEHVFLSPVYFCRLFKEQAGESFTRYVNRVKVDRARELLRTSGRKVYEVAHAVGYRDVKYFYRMFRRYTGLTPSEYRKAEDAL